ncbi:MULTISPECIES: hypothetical protein [unclassified Corynebacterium]|uniref:hypothetical protein n=1 Tax=unclassified Corynebacterium TaxID=2624378 RepID=UPI00216A5F60|nr:MULTISPECIES: hypothetical protein [unclassified Corynebacterium]MCS4491758.1 hypothetical protein [Corynebacterium sp. ES2715-CONJ3]
MNMVAVTTVIIMVALLLVLTIAASGIIYLVLKKRDGAAFKPQPIEVDVDVTAVNKRAIGERNPAGLQFHDGVPGYDKREVDAVLRELFDQLSHTSSLTELPQATDKDIPE